MKTEQSAETERDRVGCHLLVFWGLAIVTSIFAFAPFLLHAADQTQRELPPNTLWEVVHSVCVPDQVQNQNPKPCLQVDLHGGIERGFAILRDPRGGTQFLFVPTTRISGIESPVVRGPNAVNYFAIAWESRTYLNQALHITLTRDDIGMAINSSLSRSQDQLHIHISCIRPDVFEALHKDEGRIGSHWAPLKTTFFGHQYIAMWVPGDDLGPNNPFTYLAERLSGPTPDMANRTIVVIGFTRAEGTKGFIFLADRVNEQNGDLANSEELLDHACHITATNGTLNQSGS
jgi:CDP-diacylglycerol pyrophosphatase